MVNFSEVNPRDWTTDQFESFVKKAEKIPDDSYKITAYEYQKDGKTTRIESKQILEILINMVGKGLDEMTTSHVYNELKLDADSQSKWAEFQSKVRAAGAGTVPGQVVVEKSSFLESPPPYSEEPPPPYTGFAPQVPSPALERPPLEQPPPAAAPPAAAPPPRPLPLRMQRTGAGGLPPPPMLKTQRTGAGGLPPPSMQRRPPSGASEELDAAAAARERIAEQIARQLENPSIEQQEHTKWYNQIMSMKSYDEVLAYVNNSEIDIEKKISALGLLHLSTPRELLMNKRDIYMLKMKLELEKLDREKEV